MKKLFILICLNFIEIILSNIICCPSKNQSILKCERKSLKNVPNCSVNQKIEKLFLGHNNIDSLLNKSLSNFPKVEILYLNNNKISFIDLNSFSDLNHLFELRLNHNLLTYLEESLFENLSKLKYLDLNFNRFSYIPSIKSVSISRLFLRNNKIISAIFPQTFLYCKNLLKIDISNNLIEKVSNIDLLALKNCPIESFKIRDNKLTNTSNLRFFPIRRSLHHISIGNNVKLSNSGFKMILNSFDHVRHSVNWHLEIYGKNIGLSELNIDLFESISNISLTKLVLADNFIRQIEVGFGRLVDLDLLDLSGNEINHLKAYQFANLLKLSELNLRDNFINIVDEMSFKNLDLLEKLDLSRNRIDYLNTIALVHLLSLRELKLQGNSLLILSACGQPTTMIINKFIVENRLKLSTLCFSSSKCDNIIKNEIGFGFDIDIFTSVCEKNTKNLSYSSIKINNITESFIFSNMTQLRKIKKQVEDFDFKTIGIIGGLLALLAVILVIFFVYCCRKYVFGVVGCCNSETQENVTKLKMPVKDDTFCNFYESIPEIDERTDC